MNPGAPVFIPGGGTSHLAPPWPSPPTAAPSIPSFLPPSLYTTNPTILSSTNDSLQSFVLAIIFAYQQGVTAGSTIITPPSPLPSPLPPSSTQSSTSSIPIIVPPTTTAPPSSTISSSSHPSAHNEHLPIRRIPITPTTTNKNIITTPPPSRHTTAKQSSTSPPPLDYSIIINNLPIGLSGFPLIKPSHSSSILSSTPFRAMSPFIIRKDRRRKSKRNGRRSARKLSSHQPSTIKNKLKTKRGENNNNNITSRPSINLSPNPFSILTTIDIDDESSLSSLDSNHQQIINTSSPPLSSHSSTQLINNSSTSSISCSSDHRCTSESKDSLLIEAEINELVKPLIDDICMNAVMNARYIDETGADFHEWAECDAFINHPSQRPSPLLEYAIDYSH